MNENDSYERKINSVVDELCDLKAYDLMYHRANHDMPMPSTEECEQVMELLREVLFPGYFGNAEIKPETMRYYIGTNLDKIFKILSTQIQRGFCFDCGEGIGEKVRSNHCADCDELAKDIASKFIDSLPKIRRSLAGDVKAAFEGDPAAKSYGETIFCYPSIYALTNHRIAHELISLEVPLIPRIISEMAHSRTGIDIHPGATISEGLFIDHGTGVVIGETCIIGKNVRIYQGVTLGAKSFPMDIHGNPVKGIPRHPIIEDGVVIYAGATILGRVTIGRDSTIGGNVWLPYSVTANSKIMQSKASDTHFHGGSGI